MVPARNATLVAALCVFLTMNAYTQTFEPRDLVAAVETSKTPAALEAARKTLEAARFVWNPDKVEVNSDLLARSTDPGFPAQWSFSWTHQPSQERAEAIETLSSLARQGLAKARFFWRVVWLSPGAYRCIVDRVEFGTVSGGQFTKIASNFSDSTRFKISQWDFWATSVQTPGPNMGGYDVDAATVSPDRFSVTNPTAFRVRFMTNRDFDRATKATRTVTDSSSPPRNWKASPAAVAAAVPVPLGDSFNVKAAFAPEGLAHSVEFDTKYGRAYSSALVGPKVTWGGVDFVLGQTNSMNAVSPISTVVALPNGRFQNLLFLASSVFPEEENSLQVSVRYSDGTVDSFVRRVSPWDTPRSYPGETTVGTYAYRLWKEGSRDSVANHLYGYSLELDFTKTVVEARFVGSRGAHLYAASLLPPTDARGATGGLDAVQPPPTPWQLGFRNDGTRILQVPIPLPFNRQGVLRQEGLPSNGTGLDSQGYALPVDRWEGLLIDPQNSVFLLGPAAGLNGVEAKGQSLALPPGRYQKAWVLAVSTSGLQKGVVFETTFAQGKSRQTVVDVSDWRRPETAKDGERADTSPFFLAPSGRKVFLGASLYKYTVSLLPSDAGAPAAALRLPTNPHLTVLAVTLLETDQVTEKPTDTPSTPSSPQPPAAGFQAPPGTLWSLDSQGALATWLGGSWITAPGRALQIFHGVNGSVWKLGEPQRKGGYEVAFWNGSRWIPIDAGAVRLAVTASGYVTLVTSEGGVSTFALSQPADKSSAAGFWMPLASKPAQVPTSDIAFDPSRNSVWRLDRKKEPGGYGIWKQGDDGSWKQVEGAAVKIALDQQSLPWVINEAGTVYRKSSHDDNAPWVEVPGKARDFVVLPDASLSVLPADQAPGSFALQVWNGERFERR